MLIKEVLMTGLILFGIVIPVIPFVLYRLGRGLVDDIKHIMEVR